MRFLAGSGPDEAQPRRWTRPRRFPAPRLPRPRRLLVPRVPRPSRVPSAGSADGSPTPVKTGSGRWILRTGTTPPAEPRGRRPHRVVERRDEAAHPADIAGPASSALRSRGRRDRDASDRSRADDPTGGSFSPDGSEVVYAAGPWERSAIYAVSSDGGAPRLILRSTRRVSFPDGHLAFAYQPALSPDGTRIAYFDGMYDHSHNLWVANADGTKRRVLLDDEFSARGPHAALTWSPGWRMARVRYRRQSLPGSARRHRAQAGRLRRLR